MLRSTTTIVLILAKRILIFKIGLPINGNNIENIAALDPLIRPKMSNADNAKGIAIRKIIGV